MPSSLIVRCEPIKEVRPHPNADNLVILDIMGWQVVENKDMNPQIGELRIFVPPDAVLPDALVQECGISYLRKDNRVGQVKLRGIMSFGIPLANRWGFKEGEEVSEQLGITKYVPPPVTGAGDEEVPCPLFVRYCDIENYRNFPDLFTEGEEVVFLEKVDGTNSRVGMVRRALREDVVNFAWGHTIWSSSWSGSSDGRSYGEFMMGSHNIQRRLIYGHPHKKSIYQFPFTFSHAPFAALRKLIEDLQANVIILFGEIYGSISPKQMKYGSPKELKYVIFDIYVDGKYLDWDDFKSTCLECSLKFVPALYRGPFSAARAKQCANYPSSIANDNFQISEGIIIRPVKEGTYEQGRKILKLKSDAYEELKAKGKVTEFS